jgi:hypothetical protein
MPEVWIRDGWGAERKWHKVKIDLGGVSFCYCGKHFMGVNPYSSVVIGHPSKNFSGFNMSTICKRCEKAE